MQVCCYVENVTFVNSTFYVVYTQGKYYLQNTKVIMGMRERKRERVKLGRCSHEVRRVKKIQVSRSIRVDRLVKTHFWGVGKGTGP